jgi:hypothetical protein
MKSDIGFVDFKGLARAGQLMTAQSIGFLRN